MTTRALIAAVIVVSVELAAASLLLYLTVRPQPVTVRCRTLQVAP